ncbi:MAG: nitrogen regulation protein NR(I) [Casimicrobiaceae bacterium]
MNEIWIVDDDRSIRWVLEKALAREALPYRSFGNAQDVLAALEHAEPQVIVSDVRMPGQSGLEMLKRVKRHCPQVPVIVMTAYSDLDTAVQAFQGGAFEYLPKPFDIDQALALIRRAAHGGGNATTGSPEVASAPLAPGEREILGQAPAMQDLFRAIGRLSHSHVTVLITGESGTGKELVARALHEHSPRRGKPFIAINTAAIPRDLLESELFGHERGSFTGAAATRQGRFQQAEGGTLFLDEIGDMPPDMQVRLLRVLQDGEYYRVGGQAPMKANVRIIAATHQSLEERVRQGLFREDLLHRLNVVRLRLPALRDRREDIALLARHFLLKSAQTLGGEAKTLTPEALDLLSRFPFPGNVRQLENICHWITVMAPGQRVDVADLPPEVREHAAAARMAASAHAPGAAPPGLGPVHSAPALQASRVAAAPSSPSLPDTSATWHTGVAQALSRAIAAGETAAGERIRREFEITLIRAALAATRGRRIEASEWLGWGRNTLTRKIHEYGLDDEL